MSVNGSLIAGRVKILEQLNAAFDAGDHGDAGTMMLRLHGFDEAARAVCEASGLHFGNILMACDWHYINQGIDRPMCGGVFLSSVALDGP